MSLIINEYRAAEEEMKRLQERLNELSQDGKLQQELEFEKKLRALMADYQKALPDIIALLDPQGAVATRTVRAAATGTKRPRRVKRYTNPHNNEVIDTKGGNHKVLKEWKARWGGDEVESWAVVI